MSIPSQKLSTSTLDVFTVLSLERQPLYSYSERINIYLGTKLGSEYQGLFATPLPIWDNNSVIAIDWYGDAEGALTLLEKTDQESGIYREAIKKITALKNLIDVLKASEDEGDRTWGKILDQCLASFHPAFSHVNEDHLIITSWGLRPKEGYDLEAIIAPIANEKDYQQEPEDPVSPTGMAVTETVPVHHDERTQEYLEKEQEEEKKITSTINSNKITDETAQAKKEPGKEAATDREPMWRETKKSGFPWWWLLLLLLIPLFFLLRSCRSPQLLPDQPGIRVPIDSNDVVSDEEGIGKVVKDRVNVLIRNKGKSVEAFAEAFKDKYPDKAYQIIYYDTIFTQVLQIKVPETELNDIIQRLPTQFNEFDLLAWNERMFINRRKPSDPFFSNPDQSWYFDPIKAGGAWDLSYGDNTVKIAVIDDGFDLSHPELSGKTVLEWNAITRERKVNPSKHGTHVTGTALAARDNRQGLSGIAPDCSLIALQVGTSNGQLSSSAIVDAFLVALQQKADVVNMSLGMYFDERIQNLSESDQKRLILNSFPQEEKFWNELMEMAESNGVSVVLAAGNQSILAGIDPIQRSPLAIKVSAVTPRLRRAPFSNYGKTYSTLSAPGVNIYSSVPGGDFELMNGTSMAAPIVSGAVALLKSRDKTLTPAEIRSHLIHTALPLVDDIGPLVQLSTALQETPIRDPNNPNIEDPIEGELPNRDSLFIPHPQDPDDSLGDGNRVIPEDPEPPIDPRDSSYTPTPNIPVLPIDSFPGYPEEGDCAAVEERIKELLEELAILKGLCPDAGGLVPPPMMTIPEEGDNDNEDRGNRGDEDLGFTYGRWKSTTQIYNTSNEEVTIYFDFYGNDRGRITLVEPDGTQCYADLHLDRNGKGFFGGSVERRQLCPSAH